VLDGRVIVLCATSAEAAKTLYSCQLEFKNERGEVAGGEMRSHFMMVVYLHDEATGEATMVFTNYSRKLQVRQHETQDQGIQRKKARLEHLGEEPAALRLVHAQNFRRLLAQKMLTLRAALRRFARRSGRSRVCEAAVGRGPKNTAYHERPADAPWPRT
jgi:hypothetical protein